MHISNKLHVYGCETVLSGEVLPSKGYGHTSQIKLKIELEIKSWIWPLVWSMKKMWFLKPMMRSPCLLRKQAADRVLSCKEALVFASSSTFSFLPCSSTFIFFTPGSSCIIFSSISSLSMKISVTRCLFSSQILITPLRLEKNPLNQMSIYNKSKWFLPGL